MMVGNIAKIDYTILVLILCVSEYAMVPIEYQEELCTIFNVSYDSYRNYEGIGHNKFNEELDINFYSF